MKSPEEIIHYLKIIIFCYLFFGINIYAQELKFKHFIVENGLSQSNINCMIEDRTGFLWFGTQDGLNRFDGYQFKIYRHNAKDNNSLSDNNVWSLFEDNTGNIWIGTQDGNLNCFNPKTEIFKQFILDSTSTTGGNSITTLYQDRTNVLWIGTYKSGLFRFNILSGTITHWKNEPDNPNSLSNNFVTSIYEDVTGNLWIGTHNGLCIFNKKLHQGSFTRYNHDQSNPNSLSHNTVWTFFQSANDSEHIWVGTFNGLTYINTEQKSFKRILPEQDNSDPFGSSISSICEGRYGSEQVFWIGTYGGLLKMGMSDLEFTRWSYLQDNSFGLTNDRINKILLDRSGVLWIATQKGINYYSPQKDRFGFQTKEKYRGTNSDVLNGLEIQTICETSDQTVWFGTSTGLFSLRYLKNNYRVDNNSSFSNLNIWSLAAGNLEDLWIGTFGNGLKHLNINTGEIRQWRGNPKDPMNIDNAYVKAIYVDRSGLVWIGLWGAGLNRLDPKTGVISKWHHANNIPQSLSNNDVWVIFEDRIGRIWVGTYGGGLNLFNNSGSEIFYRLIHEPDNSNSLSSNNILCIYQSAHPEEKNKTQLWIGTSNGLNKLSVPNDFDTGNRTDKIKIKKYFDSEHFSSFTINSITEDHKGNLWMTTNKGMIEFDPVNEIILNTYSSSDGLSSNEFNPNSICKTKNGEIFIGSINGFNVFYPDSIRKSSYIPPVVITDFLIFNQPVPIGEDSPLKTSIITAKEIELSYSQNVFSFEFATLDHNAPETNQYAYMMEGFDNDWILSGTRRFVTYTNLDPGKYIFRVKGTNSDGIWNEEGIKLNVIINPPFWQTWWFRTILILAFLSAGPIIYFRRVTVLKKEKHLQIEFSKQLIHSQEEERKRIASELHDSLGQDLLVIKNLALLNKNKDEQFDEISKSAGIAIDDIRRISYNLHPYQLDRLGLTKAISSMFSNIEGTSKIKFEITIENIDGLFSKEQEINIYRIVQECVNNIIKHSDANDSSVTIYKSDGNVLIEVSDDGKGFDFETVKLKSEGFGLKNLENRVSFLSGKIEFNSSDVYATTVKIKIPVRIDGKD